MCLQNGPCVLALYLNEKTWDCGAFQAAISGFF